MFFAAAVLYGTELLDELIYGLHGAVLPQLRDDLSLTYTEIGLLFTVPALVSTMGEPLLGLIADTRYRRALVIGGILSTALGLSLIGIGQTFAAILLAFTILYIASGAYVSLSQATLIDRDPGRAEQIMVRWTVLGSIGVAVAPLIATAVFALGYGWRGLYLGLAGAAGLYTALLLTQSYSAHAGATDRVRPGEMFDNLRAALRMPELWRWIILTELADLMLDKLFEVTGLYFTDVVGVDVTAASGAVALATTAGLVGNLVMVPTLERIGGLRILRVTAVLVAVLYPVWLVTTITELKFVLIPVVSFLTTGWYPILQARSYQVLPGQSGLIVSIAALGNIVSLFVPVVLGQIADTFGLETAMWLLMLGPIALIIGLRSSE